ncbi:TPBG protein, partial [Polypterus senegalus]|nr:wnt-activated inhibitory factor 2 [Polypterus senegalus]MBN3289472.1 TPBG protein [Polypterus senegalus]
MAKRMTWICRCRSRAVLEIKGRPLYSGWFLITCTLFLLVRADSRCPFPCVCFENNGTVTCTDLNLSEVPPDIPPWVQTLKVTGNNITTIKTRSFLTNETSLEHMSTLSLLANNIQSIEAYAFEGLPNLVNLDLSNNKLQDVSADAFSGLRKLQNLNLSKSVAPSAENEVLNALGSLQSLRRLNLSSCQLSVASSRLPLQNLEMLDLTRNLIQNVDEETLYKWSQHKKLHIYLRFNPFLCCDLDAFYVWLKNSSQCADFGHLRCAGPETRNGTKIVSLKKEDLHCRLADLETVSYVFLGIVLALIGVIFLMVLYLNRKGIKRWLNNIREACRDQMEVYHYRYEQDSDPRLANVAV